MTGFPDYLYTLSSRSVDAIVPFWRESPGTGRGRGAEGRNLSIGRASDVILGKIQLKTKQIVQELKATANAAYAATERTTADQRRLESGQGLVMRAQFKADTVEEGQKRLFEATHWPEWYTRDFAQLAMSMKESLRSMDLKMTTEGGPTTASNTRRAGGTTGWNHSVG